MEYPTRSEWQIRCAFNRFCKQTLKNEAINAHDHTKRRQAKEIALSSLTPEEENRLYVYDTYFADDPAEQSFFVGNREITAKQLADAIHSLPEEKKNAVLLHYFYGMSDTEIGKLFNVPRGTIQSRRKSSFELLKRYLEGQADG